MKIRCLHETGIGICVGLLVGLFIYIIDDTYYKNNLKFNEKIFFFYLLPPIIYSGAYNLRKRKFFKYFYYINLYGLMSTLLSFGITAGLTLLISKAGNFIFFIRI